MQRKQIENAIKGIDTLIDGFAVVVGRLDQQAGQSAEITEIERVAQIAPNIVALFQLKEYYKQELAGRPYDRIYPRVGTE